MKTILFLFLCGMTFCLPFKNKEAATTASPESVSKAANPPASANDTINFAMQIQPILKTRCNPCHFPGGKMYEKMPFDEAKTILDHPEGILKRINEGEEGRLMRQFLEKQATKH